MQDTIKPFMDLGWFTVPLKGRIVRDENGKKSIPKFPDDWKAKCAETKNTTPARLGGVLTGEGSNILAIDCDDATTTQLFTTLDPDNPWVFRSNGKEGATLLYAYNEAVPDSFIPKHLALDVYSGSGFIYLPTEDNESKQHFGMPDSPPPPVPPATLAVLDQMQRLTQAVVNAGSGNNEYTESALDLAPLCEYFLRDGGMYPTLFKIITPKLYRSEPQYVKSGYLHPKNVPDGEGSNYLSRVSAILGAAPSVDTECYVATMHAINDLFSEPMEADRLDRTIMDVMLRNGNGLWQFDPDWEKDKLILQTKAAQSLELAFDPARNMYYAVDVQACTVKTFARDSDLIQYIGAIVKKPPGKATLKPALPLISVVSNPSQAFGFYSQPDRTTRDLNTFIRSQELAIINDPEIHEKQYKRPDTTLAYFTHLVPDDYMRKYLFEFLKRKFQTFDYSPVMLYFLGVPGSGKDTFVSLLEKIMGTIAKPTTKEFLEVFNGYLLDSYFVQLDEYGDQLTSMREKSEALGKLKAYTGKQQIQIRQMRTEGFIYRHNVTFVSTANKNPFGLEDGDRRIALFNTPTPLTKLTKDVTGFQHRLASESKDFAYYLATEVGTITNSAYMSPPVTLEKRILIADSMYAASRIAYALKYGMFDYLATLADDCGTPGLRDAMVKHECVSSEELFLLYEELTEYKGTEKSLYKALKNAGIPAQRTTNKGEHVNNYDLTSIKKAV